MMLIFLRHLQASDLLHKFSINSNGSGLNRDYNMSTEYTMQYRVTMDTASRKC